MKVLWLSTTSGLYGKSANNSYNGGGWISSLQNVVENLPNIQLALGFLSPEATAVRKEQRGKTTYYPIENKIKSRKLRKLFYYYRGYKAIDSPNWLSNLQYIIDDFKPDIIHLFGIENPLAVVVLSNAKVPIIVHLQGMLAPCNNAFFPPGFGSFSFLWPLTMREWILRNGYGFAHRAIAVRSFHELQLFKIVKFAMGRTAWDKEMLHLFAPKSSYFHVDEILRDIFYEKAGHWTFPSNEKFHIVSTFSNTVYKGLDLVLKVANFLTTHTSLKFEWNIIGLNQDNPLVMFFEHQTRIDSSSVHVKYKGVKTAEEMVSELLSANVYVHPSYIDNSPNSLCEAQMLGVPVIATRVGGVPSLIEHNISGLLVPANGLYEMTVELLKIAENRTLALQIGAEGTKVAKKRHDKKQITENLLCAYNSML